MGHRAARRHADSGRATRACERRRLATQESERCRLRRCARSVYGDSEWCVLHDESAAKDLAAFESAVEETLVLEKDQLDFSGVVFPAGLRADFFVGRSLPTTTFQDARFLGPVTFDRCTFAAPVRFVGAHFSGEASFDDADFRDDANFARALFERDADFAGARFAPGSSVIFFRTVFASSAHLYDVEFGGDVRFEAVHFRGPTDFIQSRFHGRTIFRPTTTRQHAGDEEDSLQTVFVGPMRFDHAVFMENCSSM